MFKVAPPPPRARVNARKILIFILVALGLLGAAPTLAQTDEPNELIDLQLAAAGPDCLWISYKHYPGTSARIYQLYLRPTTQVDYLNWETDATIAPFISTPGVIKFTDLQSDLSHEVIVQMENIPGESSTHYATHYFNTGAADSLPCDYVPKKGGAKIPTPVPTPRPAVNSCPSLLPDILIIGYASYHSQCRALDAGGIGRADLVQRGVIAAVDIWYYVPPTGIGVCFRNSGAQVVFLDAAYSPRRLSTLGHLTLPNGMTCALIRSAGTVVLLAS